MMYALAVGVAQQRDVRGTVRVVFDTLDLGRNAILVATEVDNTVVLLVTTADVTGGDVTVVVTASGLGLLFDQRCQRTALVQVGLTTLTMPRRPGEVGFTFTSAII
jgi:predicted SpoU family rRNA methylase